MVRFVMAQSVGCAEVHGFPCTVYHPLGNYMAVNEKPDQTLIEVLPVK